MTKWATSKGIKPGDITDDNRDAAFKAFLMNTGINDNPQIKITAIEQIESGWKITVKAAAGETPIDLEAINGQLYVKTAAELANLAGATPAVYDMVFDDDGNAIITVTGDNKNFMRATVGLKPVTPPAAE